MPDQQIVMKKYRLPLEYMIREVNFFHHCEFAPPLINYNLIKKQLFSRYIKGTRYLTLEDFFSQKDLIDEIAGMLNEFHRKNPGRPQIFSYRKLWHEILKYLTQKGENKLVERVRRFSFNFIDKPVNFSYVYGDLLPQNIIMTLKKPHKKFFVDGENGPFIKSLDSIGNRYIDVAYFIGWLISSIVYRPAVKISKGNEKDKLLDFSYRFFAKYNPENEKCVIEFLMYLFVYHLSYHYRKIADKKKGYPSKVLEYYRELIPLLANKYSSIEKFLYKIDELF